MPKNTLDVKTVQFQTNQCRISMQFNVKTVLFQVIQFSISTHFCSIWLIDRNPSGATTPGNSIPGSDDNEGVFSIPKSSNITVTSPLVCSVSWPGHSFVVGLTLCRGTVGLFYSRLGTQCIFYSENLCLIVI